MNTIAHTKEIALYLQSPPESSDRERSPERHVGSTEVSRGPLEDQVTITLGEEETARQQMQGRRSPPWMGPEYVLTYNRRGEALSVPDRHLTRDDRVDFFI